MKSLDKKSAVIFNRTFLSLVLISRLRLVTATTTAAMTVSMIMIVFMTTATAKPPCP